MPNWCSTRITINHESESELKNLEALINACMEKNYMKNGFGLDWLGNIVGNAGIGTIDIGKETDLRCRGRLNYMELYDNQLIVDTETAWVPMLKMWAKLLDKYLPDAEIIYNAEEPGCCIYATNDPDLINLYIIDSWNEDIESNWKANESKVINVLQKLLKTEETDINKLLEIFNKSDEDYDISINKWEFIEIEEWD